MDTSQLRPSPPAIPIGLTAWVVSLRNVYRRPPILSPAFRSGVIGNGVLLSGTLGGDPVLGDALVHEFSHYRVGSPLREQAILLRITDSVSMPSDRHAGVWIS